MKMFTRLSPLCVGAGLLVSVLGLGCKSADDAESGNQDDDDDQTSQSDDDDDVSTTGGDDDDDSAADDDDDDASSTGDDDDDSVSSDDDDDDDSGDEDSGDDDDDDTASDDDDDDESTGDDDDDDDDSDPNCMLGDWVDNKTDKRSPSQKPPCGLKAEQVPMFVVLGWDDQENVEGMNWSLGLAQGRTNPDGSPIRFTYYNTTFYVSEGGSAWKDGMEQGHEMGNHTDSHNEGKMGFDMSVDEWENEISTCEEKSATVGISREDMYGVRAPRLEQWDSMFQVVHDHGYMYDCSIEEGMQDDQGAGTNYYWPYTLDEGSPGDKYADWDHPLENNYPGLWEMPVYSLVVPNDDECEKYGCEPGLFDRIKAKADWFEPENPKWTGFDYNIMYLAEMNAAEYLALLKISFDRRMEGNRAPFLFGTHTGLYADSKSIPNMTPAEARSVIEEFLDYVLQHEDVRVTSAREVLEWIRNPEPLR
jgi:peptidoglycan/xylan/chitin deacetylase (PgdA/CDA1 family)